jgi:anti-sigma-K factor RskA
VSVTDEERLQDLIVQRALEGITLDEAREIALLAEAYPDVDIEGIEAAIAALDAIELGATPPLPASITSAVMDRLPKAAEVTPLPARSGSSPLPWMALAATMVIAALGWYRALSPAAPLGVAAPVAIAQMPDAGRWDFEPTDDPAGQQIEGEVRWTTTGQRGEMQLRGLPKNDPAQEQYQVWIFDATRTDAHPIDGGVFDVQAGGDQIVAIRPTLKVRQPTLFAITIEPPGGVMVSDRERLVALAKVP